MKLPRLREWRESRGLTQRELARRARVGEKVVPRGEADESIRPNTARKLADALGIEVVDLMESPPVPLGEPQSAALRHLRGKEDAMAEAAARIDAAKKAAGPQRPPVAQIIERLGEQPRVLWYIPEDERAEWRADLDTQYPDGYLEEDAPPEFVVEDQARVKTLA